MTSPRLDDTLRDQLLADHRRIETLVATLALHLDADAGAAAALAWGQLETAVLTHIDQEELHLLPAFEAVCPADAAALRADHARFRTALGELGVALGLRRVGAHEVRAFGVQLRDYAAREDATLYPWADRHASPYHARALLERLHAAR